jgi:hypothetical protein
MARSNPDTGTAVLIVGGVGLAAFLAYLAFSSSPASAATTPAAATTPGAASGTTLLGGGSTIDNPSQNPVGPLSFLDQGD